MSEVFWHLSEKTSNIKLNSMNFDVSKIIANTKLLIWGVLLSTLIKIWSETNIFNKLDAPIELTPYTQTNLNISKTLEPLTSIDIWKTKIIWWIEIKTNYNETIDGLWAFENWEISLHRGEILRFADNLIVPYVNVLKAIYANEVGSLISKLKNSSEISKNIDWYNPDYTDRAIDEAYWDYLMSKSFLSTTGEISQDNLLIWKEITLSKIRWNKEKYSMIIDYVNTQSWTVLYNYLFSTDNYIDTTNINFEDYVIWMQNFIHDNNNGEFNNIVNLIDIWLLNYQSNSIWIIDRYAYLETKNKKDSI